MAYEDVTLLTSDSVKIKAYVIPARRNIKSKEQMMEMTPAQRDELGKEAMKEWVKEMGEDQTIEVSRLLGPSDLSSNGVQLIWQYAKSRLTIVIFHANAGKLRFSTSQKREPS